MRVIALENIKGGVGKSFVACQLAAFSVRQGFRTCLVDIDKGNETGEAFVTKQQLDGSELKFARASTVRSIKETMLKLGKLNMDVVVVDTPSNQVAEEHRAVAQVSNLVLVPTQAEQWPGLRDNKTVAMLESWEINYQVALNLVDNRRAIDTAVLAESSKSDFGCPLVALNNYALYQRAILERQYVGDIDKLSLREKDAQSALLGALARIMNKLSEA